MKKDEIIILAIETSCDETAAAVIVAPYEFTNKTESEITNNAPLILSNVISSSADLHAKTAGIVPEVASRAQMEAILPVVEQALQQANSKLRSGDLLEGITHIAVTNGPGLIGSLLVGFNAAKTIAYARNLPFISINHIEGHIYSAFAGTNREKLMTNNFGIEFPILALTVSGGHTSLTLMSDHGKYQTQGETIDDAAGEAFDKVAKLLGLGYPGGPEVSKLAEQYRNKVQKSKSKNQNEEIEFPRPLINQPNFNFSFSGLKTAVLTQVKKLMTFDLQLTTEQKEQICWAFEEAAVDVLCTKAIKAARKCRPKAIILAGGVAANRRLQQELRNRIEKYNLEVEEKHQLNFFTPGVGMTGDNAAMIGIAAYYRIVKNNIPELFGTTVDSNLSL